MSRCLISHGQGGMCSNPPTPPPLPAPIPHPNPQPTFFPYPTFSPACSPSCSHELCHPTFSPKTRMKTQARANAPRGSIRSDQRAAVPRGFRCATAGAVAAPAMPVCDYRSLLLARRSYRSGGLSLVRARQAVTGEELVCLLSYLSVVSLRIRCCLGNNI